MPNIAKKPDEYDFSKAMRAARHRSGLSVSELACASDVAANTIYNYEGSLCAPSVTCAVKLSRALGLTLEEYLGLKPPKIGRVDVALTELRNLARGFEKQQKDIALLNTTMQRIVRTYTGEEV